jgi:hypothetical protein
VLLSDTCNLDLSRTHHLPLLQYCLITSKVIFEALIEAEVMPFAMPKGMTFMKTGIEL